MLFYDRFQRAYVDYFSTQHARLRGDYKALLQAHLWSSTALVCGLFGGSGQAMILLSDAIEARHSVMIIRESKFNVPRHPFVRPKDASVDTGQSLWYCRLSTSPQSYVNY